MPKSITLAMIVLNEEHTLPRLLATVRQYVDELIVVDTGSTDRTRDIAEAAGARVLHYTAETNPEGFMMDDASSGAPEPYSGKMVLANYSGARQVGLDAATSDYVLWLDADDVLIGGDKLARTVADMEAQNLDIVWLKYNYGHDPMGRVACELWRERLIKRGTMRWINPIHEVMIPVGEPKAMKSAKIGDIYVDHHRPAARSAVVAHRNYKVLLRHIRANPSDARTLFYFANEARIVNPQQALQAYERYCLVSGWGEERCMAHVYIGEMYEAMKDIGRAHGHYSAATVVDPRMPEGWFALARLAYATGQYADCVRFTEEGLKRGIPDSVIMVNPLARSIAPHIFYHIALNAVGRVEDGYKSALAGLAVAPEQPELRINAQKFRRFLDERVAEGQAATTPLSAEAREGITLALAPHDATSPPLPASSAILEAAALQLWKACLAGGEPALAEELLHMLPIKIREAPAIDQARARTQEILRATPVTREQLGEVRAADGRPRAYKAPARIPQPAWDQPQSLWRQTPRELREELLGMGHASVPNAYLDGDHLVATISDVPPPDGLEVVIWTGGAAEPWTALSPRRGGIGGSETACVEMARELAKRGCRVTVYSDCGEGEGIYDSVDYKHYSRFTGCKCDVFISSRQPHIADMPIEARLKLLWIHDVHVGQPDPNMHRWLLRFDRLMCLTDWHRDLVLKTYPWVHPAQVVVTRNGIDPARFGGDVEIALVDGDGKPSLLGVDDQVIEPGTPNDIALVARFPPRLNRAFYSSSPNRGLDALLDLWPHVRNGVPDAELHVFYGFDSWEATARLQGNQAELAEIERYKKRLAETPGVTWRGRVSQAALAHEMLQCKVWAYPTWFTETYCITAIEAQAAGCLPICTNLAALTETVRWGVRLDGQPSDEEYRAMFVAACVRAMTDEDSRAAITHAGRTWALTKSWAALADEWMAMFAAMIVEVTAQPVPRYQQIPAVRAA